MCIPGKNQSFFGVIIQRNRNYLLQRCEKLLEMFRKKLFESLRYNTVIINLKDIKRVIIP